MRLYCVSDGLPDETPRLLREACRDRRIEFLEIDAAAFDFDPGRRLGPGDLLFRPSASLRSQRVEQFLYADGVATLYRRPDDLFRNVVTPRWVLERAGIRMPKALFCSSDDRCLLERHVETLGGLPVVVKLGGEAGRGTLVLDSWPALFSFFDYCCDRGLDAEMCAFIPNAEHWRVVVVGDAAVAAYRNPLQARDFRTLPSSKPSDYTPRVEPRLAALACAATHALGVEFSGVDILRDGQDTDWVLEVNSPCYFPQAQLVAGIDVAGAIVDALMAKAR